MVVLLQIFAKAAGSKKDPETPNQRPTSRPPPLPPVRPQTDEDRVRKFLEALGQPTTARPPPPVVPRTAPDASAENVRKRIVEAQSRQRKAAWGNPLPPLTTVPPPIEQPRRVFLPSQMTQPPYEEKASIPQATTTPSFEVQQQAGKTGPPPLLTAAEAYAISTQPRPKADASKTELAALLTSPAGLRQAIILREVFGPPRSLQPLELTGV